MKMNKFTLFVVLIISIFLGILLSNISEHEFVKRCTDLNGKDLTYENVAMLNGTIYIAKEERDGSGSVGLYDLKKEHIDQYLQSFTNKLDPYTPHPNVYNESFDMSRGGLDNDWRCNIQVAKENQKIKATPYFQPGA